MSTRRALVVFGLLAIAAQTACAGDSPTSPIDPVAITDVSDTTYSDQLHADATFGAAPTESPAAVRSAGDTTVTVMMVDPNRAMSFAVAPAHKIFFPNNTICDPATSSYGPTAWDEPCTKLTAPIEVTARAYTTPEGYPRVDFMPALRFSHKGNLSVTLWLKDRSTDPAQFFTVLYCPDAPAGTTAVCVDESEADRKQSTHADRSRGLLYRRLKHFSGYTVGVGRSSLR